MKQISLASLTLINFKSFRNHTINLSTEAGLKLISGDNRIDPRLGANGAGKSSVFDALCFCLYGNSVRGVRASDLISYGEKAVEVVAVFAIDNEYYTVKRTSPPSRIYINDEQVEQETVDRLVGLSRSRFLNSVVFGQAAPLFIDLPIPTRGELLDEVLDLEFWQKAADKVTQQHNQKTAEITRIRSDIARIEGRLSGLDNLEAIQLQESTWEDDRQARVNELIEQVELLEKEDFVELRAKESTWEDARMQRILDVKKELGVAELDVKTLTCSLDALKFTDVDPKPFHETWKTQGAEAVQLEKQKSVLEHQLSHTNEQVDFFAANLTCPTCAQAITNEFSKPVIRAAAQEIDKIVAELGTVTTKLLDLLNSAQTAHQVWRDAEAQVTTQKVERQRLTGQIDARRVKISALQTQVKSIRAENNSITARIAEQVAAKERQLSELEKHAETVASESNPYTARRQRIVALQAEINAELTNTRTTETAALSALSSLDFWRQGFKRVRLFCVKRVLQQLELETMNAANSLGLVGWKITFTTETETKSGTMKPGIQIEVASPTMSGRFDNWSGGEGQRIRLCVALGLSSLIQRWAGVIFKFEVFDEPSAWLSSEGIEDLLELLRARAESYSKSIWICDHRALIYSGFSEIQSVVKDENGSHVELVSRSRE